MLYSKNRGILIRAKVGGSFGLFFGFYQLSVMSKYTLLNVLKVDKKVVFIFHLSLYQTWVILIEK